MVCRVAENGPLSLLQKDIGAAKQCHSTRPNCVHRLPRANSNGVFGVSGAFIGYCQALFSFEGTPSQNTKRISGLLEASNLPWHLSHELFWGHKGAYSVTDFFTQAAEPLMGDGRVPILISGLDPHEDGDVIDQVLASKPTTVDGETVLLRIVPKSSRAFESVESLIRKLTTECLATRQMPRWWPLVQGSGTVEDWSALAGRLGPLWKYVNVAVNPFTEKSVFEVCREQVTVAQLVAPHVSDIGDDGTIRLSAGMTIPGAVEGATYNLDQFLALLSKLEVWPTTIILGPTQSSWTEEDNVRRVEKLTRMTCDRIQKIWGVEAGQGLGELFSLAA